MKKNLKLSILDKKILYELDINARIPLTTLAKKARASPATVEYRLRRMESAGLIKGYLTFLDAGKLGLMIWNVYLELENTTEDDEKKLVAYLCGLKRTWWVARCSGKWSLIYSICVFDVKELFLIVNDVQAKFSTYIQNQSIAAHAEVDIMSRGYFLRKPGVGKPWFLECKKVALDASDIKILKAISRDARLPSTEIAKRTGLTQRIVIYRMKELVKSGIINRFRLLLDVSMIGLSFYKAILFVKDYDSKKNVRLKEYCLQEGNIFHYEQKVGPWMLELELDSENYEAADAQLKKMKEAFSDFIRSYDLLLIRDEPKGDIDLTNMI